SPAEQAWGQPAGTMRFAPPPGPTVVSPTTTGQEESPGAEPAASTEEPAQSPQTPKTDPFGPPGRPPVPPDPAQRPMHPAQSPAALATAATACKPPASNRGLVVGTARLTEPRPAARAAH